MGGTLPNEAADAHATPETARPLQADPSGALMPFLLHSDPALAAISSKTRENWYGFVAADFAKLDLQLNFYPLLGNVFASLVPDDADSRALPELVQNLSLGFMQITGVIAPGSYKLKLSGPLNLYELSVRLTNAPLQPDRFEPNDTFETATPFDLTESGALPPRVLLANAGGQYDLSLHRPTDKDFFRIIPVITQPLSVPVVQVSLCDAPVDITLFDSHRNVLNQEFGVRFAKLTLPVNGTSILEVSGANATRYRLTLRLEIDQSRLPGPLQGQVVVPLPDLGDPALQIDPDVNHLQVEVDSARLAIGSVTLASDQGQPLKVALLDSKGQVVLTAFSSQQTLGQLVTVSLKDLDLGAYVLRVEHADGHALSSVSPLTVQVVPSFYT
jgi:hypothetical protein